MFLPCCIHHIKSEFCRVNDQFGIRTHINLPKDIVYTALAFTVLKILGNKYLLLWALMRLWGLNGAAAGPGTLGKSVPFGHL